jgi:hypothetical protein
LGGYNKEDHRYPVVAGRRLFLYLSVDYSIKCPIIRSGVIIIKPHFSTHTCHGGTIDTRFFVILNSKTTAERKTTDEVEFS